MPSSVHRIRRPLWRAFRESALPGAARHVRAGGHALVWSEGKTRPAAWLLLPCDRDGGLPELTSWSLLNLRRRSYDRIEEGTAAGLALLRLPRRFEDKVNAWCARDERWPGSERDVELDCTACGACCQLACVRLEEHDLDRWRAARRADLCGKRFVSTGPSQPVLNRRQADGACVHLRGTRCGIYALRPEACRVFLPGSEQCLTARRRQLGVAE